MIGLFLFIFYHSHVCEYVKKHKDHDHPSQSEDNKICTLSLLIY